MILPRPPTGKPNSARQQRQGLVAMGRAPWRARLRRPHARRSQARDRAATAPGGTPARRARIPADAAPRRACAPSTTDEPQRRHHRPQPLEVAQVRVVAADHAEHRHRRRGQPLQRDHLRRVGAAHRGERARVLAGEQPRRAGADLLLRRRRLVPRPQADGLRAERSFVHLRRFHVHAPLVRLRPAEPARRRRRASPTGSAPDARSRAAPRCARPSSSRPHARAAMPRWSMSRTTSSPISGP